MWDTADGKAQLRLLDLWKQPGDGAKHSTSTERLCKLGYKDSKLQVLMEPCCDWIDVRSNLLEIDDTKEQSVQATFQRIRALCNDRTLTEFSL